MTQSVGSLTDQSKVITGLGTYQVQTAPRKQTQKQFYVCCFSDGAAQQATTKTGNL